MCYLYYYLWITLLPRWKGYRIRPEILDVDEGSGANTHRLVKVPLAELEEWDATHDDAGFLRRRRVPSPSSGNELEEKASNSDGVEPVTVDEKAKA